MVELCDGGCELCGINIFIVLDDYYVLFGGFLIV